MVISGATDNRDSAFELLRIVAQWMIVMYHLLYFHVYPATGDVFYKAIQMPLHIGVILYLLTSGYFGIRPSIKKLFFLLVYVAIYTIPLLLIYDYDLNKNLFQTTLDVLFVSRSPYWFVRTYIFLFLLSPVINYWISEQKRSLYLLSVLFFICIYVGVLGSDETLWGGKNLLNFVFLYVLGYEFRRSSSCKSYNIKKLLLLWLILNVILVYIYNIFSETLFGKLIWMLSYPYNSPIIVLNATVFFMIFTKLKLKSKAVNYIAGSSFAIYLIHCHPFVNGVLLPAFFNEMTEVIQNHSLTMAVIILMTFGILTFSIIIDKALTPLWIFVNSAGEKLAGKLERYQLDNTFKS